ncbi:hypothetical protein QTP70_015221 [Hemibagrus guttatus]|uniref:MI domain-containing protein n=1 Tax=Hemibagrus guttatus TaxID=175788 RepID=A0AAE0QSS4_9TELE|nr:hypothetical protein QTP70_015221 [Hemibagrus guttatus]
MQRCQMATPVEIQDGNAGFIRAGLFYPTFHPPYEGYRLQQQREHKLIIITDPNDCDRDVMAELYGVKTSSLLTAHPKCSVTQTRSQKKPREPVRFFIPLTEEEKEEAKKANIVFGDFLSDHLTLTGGDIVEAPAPLQTTPPKEVEPNNTPESAPLEVQCSEPRPTASSSDPKEKKRYDVEFLQCSQLVSDSMLNAEDLLDILGVVLDETCQSRQSLHKRQGLLLFSIPPEEEVQQKKTEKVNTRRGKKQNKAEVQKTRSQKKPREPVRFFIPLTEEEKEEAKKANIIFGDFLSDHLTLTGGDIVEAPAPPQTTPTKEVEPNNTPEPAPVKVQPSEPRPAASPSNPKERRMYNREFMLSLRFVSASMGRPEGLPDIPGVVLDKQVELNEPHKIIASVSLNNDVQLNKAEKAWKPAGKKSRGGEDDQEMVKTQELFQKVRSILNKLTPEMFQQLMKRVTELTIDTEERLKGVVDLVFEKAISEPNFSVTYANMCRYFMGLEVPTSDNSGASVNFRRLLLKRCQKEFERDKDDDEKQKELDAATEEEVQQRLNAARHRSLGNIKFIGELFKLKLMKEQVMHVCIVKLLKDQDEESLECLCRLLSTIGKNLDLEKSKNNWVPRRGDQGPKTIDQVHKDAELEEQREMIKVQQLLLAKKQPRQGRRGEMNQPQDEGRNTVLSSTKKRPMDTSSLSKLRALDINNLHLAPGGKGTWASIKGSSSGTGAKTSTEQAAGFSAMCTPNPFSALQLPEPSSMSSSSSLDSKPSLPQDQELDRKVSKLALSEEEVEKKSTAIMEEYLHINDLKETVQCVKELNSASVLFVFVRNAVELAFNRCTVSREHTGLLLHKLISSRVLPPEQYFRGLREILEVADDMAIDIPHIWQYLAEIITPMLHDGGIPMGLLFREVTKPLLSIGKAAVLLVHILNRLSHDKAGVLWIDAGLNWKDFLPEDEDVNKFMTEQKVEFTLGRSPERSS